MVLDGLYDAISMLKHSIGKAVVPYIFNIPNTIFILPVRTNNNLLIRSSNSVNLF